MIESLPKQDAIHSEKVGSVKKPRIGPPRYEIILYWSDADEAFIAEVPELPGCAADGQSYEEAVRNAAVVIEEWLETAKSLGRSIPEPEGRLTFA